MEKRMKVDLTTEERDLIVDKTFAGPPLTDPLEKKLVHGDMITVYYSPQDLEELLGFIAAEANHTKNKTLEVDLDCLYDKLEDILEKDAETE
jgi:hypothetical protein